MQQQEEWEWIIVDGYDFTDKYMISNYGRCSSYCGAKHKYLKPKIGKYNYRYYHLSTGLEKPRTISVGVGKLVAETFGVPGKSEYTPFVNHIDHDPSNNYVGNLEFVAGKYNTQYSQGIDIFLWRDEDEGKVYTFKSRRDAAEFLGLSKGAIDYYVKIKTGKTARGWNIKVSPLTGKQQYQQGL